MDPDCHTSASGQHAAHASRYGKVLHVYPLPDHCRRQSQIQSARYWRGPIWLDQTYFAIRGLRNYGYNRLADEYTLQVFDRLSGLKEGAPIHENYGTHTGERLKAPHFSWSSSHLLMMYDDYGK